MWGQSLSYFIQLIHSYNSCNNVREPALQNAFISGVDRSRLVSQRNKGTALDCQYSDYSIHYNICNQMAKQIEELHAGFTSTTYLRLKQQFNIQFKRSILPLPTKSPRSSPTPSATSLHEMGFNPVDRLRRASAPLKPSDYGVSESVSDGMESIASVDESDWETVGGDSQNEDDTSFASVHVMSDSGR